MCRGCAQYKQSCRGPVVDAVVQAVMHIARHSQRKCACLLCVPLTAGPTPYIWFEASTHKPCLLVTAAFTSASTQTLLLTHRPCCCERCECRHLLDRTSEWLCTAGSCQRQQHNVGSLLHQPMLQASDHDQAAGCSVIQVRASCEPDATLDEPEHHLV